MKKSLREGIVLIFLLVVGIETSLLIFVLLLQVSNKTMLAGLGDLSNWIGSAATFYGSIIGGVISGALTLIGVRYTIKRERLKDTIKNYPERRLLADQLAEELEYIHEWCERHYKNENLNMLRSHLAELVMNNELLEKASKVSDSVYENVRMTYVIDIKGFYEKVKEIKGYGGLQKLQQLEYHLTAIKETAETVKVRAGEISQEYQKIKETY